MQQVPKNSTIQYNTIQYKTCNAPYVTVMLFVGAGLFNYLKSLTYRRLQAYISIL